MALREPHGEKALMPAERKPCFVSGTDMALDRDMKLRPGPRPVNLVAGCEMARGGKRGMRLGVGARLRRRGRKAVERDSLRMMDPAG